MTIEQSLPKEFTDRIKQQLGAEYNLFLTALEEEPPVSLRLNPWKPVSVFDSCEKITWATGGYYLPERISFTLDPLFQAGCYYVQEASSMFIENAIRQITDTITPVKILDLCAAPGGKSTHLLSTLPPGSLLVSNEIIPSRNNILQQNITKWGNGNVVITQNEATDFEALPGFFDIIVVDAPCSGEGLFRKQPDAVNEWSTEAVNNCAKRQSVILDDIYDALKEGGHIIYCTCTFESIENDDQCKRLIEKYNMEPVLLSTVPEGITKTIYGLQFYPHKIKGEGFYISVLKKMETSGNVSYKGKAVHHAAELAYLKSSVSNPDQFNLFKKKDELYGFPVVNYIQIMLLMEKLFVRKAGIHLGTLKGKDLVPGHELALSHFLNEEIARVELTSEEAIRYLRCENIVTKEIPNGWAVVTFNNFPLGWIKGIGSRINNYFPRSQRILKS